MRDRGMFTPEAAAIQQAREVKANLAVEAKVIFQRGILPEAGRDAVAAGHVEKSGILG